ncbi:MAG: hypothetical protein M1820_004204 [Bogoriella megaspora]|nr:MAG: hypothetical protein M1820_004204 [Bogoriella megaspora]
MLAFLSLPLELRLIIYENFFKLFDAGICLNAAYGGRHREDASGLLLSCKKINSEATEALCKSRTTPLNIVFDSDSQLGRPPPLTYWGSTTFLFNRLKAYLPLIRDLTIYIDFYDCCTMTRTYDRHLKFLKSANNLRNLRVVVVIFEVVEFHSAPHHVEASTYPYRFTEQLPYDVKRVWENAVHLIKPILNVVPKGCEISWGCADGDEFEFPRFCVDSLRVSVVAHNHILWTEATRVTQKSSRTTSTRGVFFEPLTLGLKLQLYEEGKCFRCRQPGHRSYHKKCPNNKWKPWKPRGKAPKAPKAPPATASSATASLATASTDVKVSPTAPSKEASPAAASSTSSEGILTPHSTP